MTKLLKRDQTVIKYVFLLTILYQITLIFFFFTGKSFSIVRENEKKLSSIGYLPLVQVRPIFILHLSLSLARVDLQY